jgi:hypothetical protein
MRQAWDWCISVTTFFYHGRCGEVYQKQKKKKKKKHHFSVVTFQRFGTVFLFQS